MTGLTRRPDSCYTCRFWVGFGARERGPKGQCRRFPPAVTDRAPAGSFPITQIGDWCGEWQRSSGRTAEDRPPEPRQAAPQSRHAAPDLPPAGRTLYNDLGN